MLKHAANEIRLHPSRFVATLAAIAISVGFVAAISTVVNTESEAVARSNILPISRADVVVTGDFEEGTGVVDLLEGVPGVTRAAPASTGFGTLVHDDRTVFATLVGTPTEEFRWAEMAEGRWPTGANEVALTAEGLDQLDLQVGDELRLGDSGGPRITVVGRTADAKSLYAVTAYISEEHLPSADSAGLFVAAVDETPVVDVIAGIEQVLPDTIWEDAADVRSGAEARQQALTDMTGDVDLFKYLLYGFAGIALVVGMIIISNTFTILVTQRRRQIGLLRAVGASTGQVRGRLVSEALLLGLIGSVLGVLLGIGVAAGAALYTGSIFWGLALRPAELGVAIGVGVLATLISVLGPSLAATRVKPLEALQVVPSAAQAKKASVTRMVLCGVMVLAGAGLIVLSRQQSDQALVWAMIAGALISVAVLAAAPLYVAPLLRGIGKLVGFGSPTLRLAAQNSARNPKRAAATTVALMLSVGLVVTLQVAVATIRTTGMAAIDQQFPQDLVAIARSEMSADFVETIRQTEGAASVQAIESKETDDLDDWSIWIRNINPARAELGLPAEMDVAEGDLIVSDWRDLPDEVTLPGVDAPVRLRVKESGSMSMDTAAVAPATFEQIAGEPAVTELWVKLTDRRSPTVLNAVTQALEEGQEGLYIQGGAVLAGVLEEVLDVILVVLTALLGVAVVIALVGVSNTLGLSVIERQRESALLRALGMQRSGLRLMLLAEAILLAAVGAVIGIAFGAFFGWLGVSSSLLMMGDEINVEARFAIDVPLTLALIGVCVAAAALASVLPGRKAANATPTEALAAV